MLLNEMLLSMQAFDQEMASLPGCYSSPAGAILLLFFQSSAADPAQAVGCVAVRPLQKSETPPAQSCSSAVAASPTHLQAHPQQLQAGTMQNASPAKQSTRAATAATTPPTTATAAGDHPGRAAADRIQVCEMKRLWVSPDHLGKGLGRALASAAVSAARQRGYKVMVLDTLQSLAAANKVYASLGFEQREAYYENPLPGVVYWQLQL